MASITGEEFDRLLRGGFQQQAVHLEARDAYGTAVELPYMAKWAAGEPDDLHWLQGWCSTLRDHVAAGRSVRRAIFAGFPAALCRRWLFPATTTLCSMTALLSSLSMRATV